MTGNVLEVFELLRSVRRSEIRDGVLSAEVTNKLDHLCDAFETSNDGGRITIADHVTPEISFLFFNFADWMAIAAVREMSEKCVRRGLEAIAIENCTFDWRDSVVRMVLLYRSAVMTQHFLHRSGR